MLYKWLLANKISLNCAKTESIIFHKPGQKPTFNFKIKMNGHRVRPSDFIKYLGIYLDSTLSGRFHCEILARKLKRANGMLCKIRHYVPDTELRSIYYAIFSSHIPKFGGNRSQNIMKRYSNYKIKLCASSLSLIFALRPIQSAALNT